MQIQDFKLFLEVAELGSFTRAARALSLSVAVLFAGTGSM